MIRTTTISKSLFFASCLLIARGVLAEEVPVATETETESVEETRTPVTLKKLTVVGSAEDASTVPGSAHLLTGETLAEAQSGESDIHRILRQVPGVVIQEEDGYGLRPNIGFRGVSSERSGKITLMEDGVLIAPAPYSAPAAYYFPTAGRMEGIEVTKGAGTIKYGPHTIAGAVNMLSTSIPEETTAKIKAQVGSDSYSSTHTVVGDSWTYGGVMVESYQAETNGFKQLDGANGQSDTGFDIADYVFKGRVNTDPSDSIYHELELKLNVYDQDSNETYMGLTQEDFDANPFRRYAASQLDHIDVDHRTVQLRHYGTITDNIDITTTGYFNKTNRNWFKADSVGGVGLSDVLDDPTTYSAELGWLRGDENSADDAITLRNNARAYTSKGVESVVGFNFEHGDVAHELQVGVRYHTDDEDRYQDDDKFRMENGRLVLTSDGAPSSQANRISEAEAVATYLYDTISYENLTLRPGVRWEHIDYSRDDFGKVDPDRTGSEVKTVDTTITAILPGVGGHIQLTDEVGAFAGIHKGFTPPGAAGNDSVDEEESINYELGTSYKKDSVDVALVGFYNNYDNLLGFDSLSAGGSGSGEAFNAGEARSYGLEASASVNLLESVSDTAWQVPFKVAYTLTKAEFTEGFQDELFGLVTDGDDIPYIPENQLFVSLGVKHDVWSAWVSSNYLDKMLAYAGSADAVANSKTDDFFVFDLNGEVKLNEHVSLFGTIENIFDEEYVVARRPAGARPGQSRAAFAGVKVAL